ncbi:unnamed protein product [Cylicocyclus nassatus]|uniref:SSD domain-containing protein n=1 Tax=Cylicocyclus nassatus TaxID=53992 RepID=A0AA36MC38_CYLNA|nr:unnamed protein product [Cylicocyclus nassatus]
MITANMAQPQLNVERKFSNLIVIRASINAELLRKGGREECIRFSKEVGDLKNFDRRNLIAARSHSCFLEVMDEMWLTRGCTWVCRRVGKLVATWPRTTIFVSIVMTAVFSTKVMLTPHISRMDGWTTDNARSRYEFNVFQEFLNADGQGITLFLLLRARDNQSMIRPHYLNQTVEILNFVSSHFLMYDADLGRNQSFDEFCRGFCMANEPVRQYFNGMRILAANTSFDIANRIDLAYPTSEMFYRAFSLLPNFFGIKLNEDGRTLKSVDLIALIFRAEKHRSWTTTMVKEWELQVQTYFEKDFDQSEIEVSALSPSIVEYDIMLAGNSLRPFLLVGFVIMCIFCTTTTILSSVTVYHHKATFNKVILSITACVLPFMACGTAFGIVFLLGVTFSPILNVTPFLVLAISVDDAFLMVHSWNRIEKDDILSTKSRPDKMVQVLVETGPAITISAFTNILAFAIGAYSSPPEIRLFCIGNAACIFMDMTYQLTFYTAVMALFADSPKAFEEKKGPSRIEMIAQGFLHKYSGIIADWKASLAVVVLWALYFAGAITGLFFVNIDLSSQKMFLPDSKLIKIDSIRNRYMVPYYTSAMVVVNNPGNISDPENVRQLLAMKNAFETLPDAIGPESTKFFLDDYLLYKESIHEELETNPGADSIESFLGWMEYSFWKGFVKLENTTDGLTASKFMFITGYHGQHLVSWVEKGHLLKALRDQVDRFGRQFNATVFSDDAFYIDLLEAIPTITWQSGLATFVCVIIVCAMFINHFATIFIVSTAILATCIGVFGYTSLLGVTLDPIVMSIAIMCIGFSVDIPAHVSFHYHAARLHTIKKEISTTSTCSSDSTSTVDGPNFRARLQHTLCSVGFPVVQAGLSSILCALPLAFVPLYMAQVFALAMVMCISFSLIHGVVVLPAMFCLHDRISTMSRLCVSHLQSRRRCAPA